MEIGKRLSEKAKRDLILVNMAKEGDEKAYASLMNRYRDSIYYLILKMINNPSDADDLTIDTFGKAFKSIDKYTPDFAFSTWLFRIATNGCIDFIRKKRQLPPPLDNPHDNESDFSLLLPSDSPDPEELMINEQRIRRLREVVDQLKPIYRDLIELRYYKEYSYDEMALKLDIPVGTVKARLNRAKLLLLNIYQKTEKR